MIEGTKQTVFAFIARMVDHWPFKIAAIIAAVMLWLFVSTASVAVTQRSLLIPIHIEGLDTSEVASGIPNYVEVTISGPNNRVNRLNPESLYAFIQLPDSPGSFEGPIEVSVPNKIDLISVTPSEVIGAVEVVSTKLVPVAVVFQGEIPRGRSFETSINPDKVLVRGRANTLDLVTQVTAPISPIAGIYDLAIFASDVNGLPIPAIEIQPETIAVSVKIEPITTTRTVPLIVRTPNIPGSIVTIISERHLIELLGPEDLLADLNAVPGIVELPTLNPLPGDYTLPVSVTLPEGLRENFISSARVRVQPQP